MGMPGWPDFAASTASIASARIELASSPSDAGRFIGGRKLYSAHAAAPLQPPGGLRAPRFGAGARRRTLVRVPRHRPAGRAGAARSAPERRPAGAPAAVVGPAAVAEKPQLVGGATAQNPIPRALAWSRLLGCRGRAGGRGARRDGLGGTARAVLGARRCTLRAGRPGAAARRMGPHAPVLRALRHPHRSQARRARTRLPRLQPAEIADAKWFEVLQLPRLPSKISIARRLIDAVSAQIRGEFASE